MDVKTWKANDPSRPPTGFHSVYGQAGKTSGLVNDEMITYYIETNPKAKA